jgi:hypothetical protein
MEVALRRRLAGVADVSISQREQTAIVTFRPGTSVFSAAEFRNAVAEADVEVISLELEICGVVDAENVLRASTDVQQTRLRLHGPGAQAHTVVCATGHLDDRVDPYELHVTTLRPRS